MSTFNIEDFFSKKFENDSTKLLLDQPSYFSASMMEVYVQQLAGYSLADYVSYLSCHPIVSEITSRDITQLSSIDDCTLNMCNIMRQNHNKGLTLSEIATYLRVDNSYKDNVVALIKYGENQVKTACQMGLFIYRNDLWYLTSIGYIMPDLSEVLQNKFFAINLLRDPFYSKIVLSLCCNDTNIRDYMTILSESTQKRRSSSCQKVFSYFKKQCKVEGFAINELYFK